MCVCVGRGGGHVACPLAVLPRFQNSALVCGTVACVISCAGGVPQSLFYLVAPAKKQVRQQKRVFTLLLFILSWGCTHRFFVAWCCLASEFSTEEDCIRRQPHPDSCGHWQTRLSHLLSFTTSCGICQLIYAELKTRESRQSWTHRPM